MIIEKHHLKTKVEITQTQLGISQEYKQQCIEEVYRLGDSMNQKTNVKAIMSSYAIWEESQIFNSLLDNIIKTINVSYPILDSRAEYNLENTWSAIYKRGHYTSPHNHTPSNISFVYYLQSSGNTPLIFNDSNFQINPIDDTLIIFPSYLYHSVPKHMEEKDRICLAGNLNFLIKTK